MAPHVVSFISAKGGSGKTVTSSALATFLSGLGLKVLLIDVDAATNGLTLLFLEQLLGKKRVRVGDAVVLKNGVFECENGRLPDKISISETLDVVPAAYRMSDTEKADPHTVAETLTDLIGRSTAYDLIFLDAQAGADTFARMAASIAETNIIVSEYDPVSSQGVERLKALFGDLLVPANTWTLFNKVLPEFTTSIGEGLAVARFLPPVPWDADVVRAFTRRDLAVDMANPNPYTLAVAQLGFTLVPDVAGDLIHRWRKEVSPSVTSLVEDRLRGLILAEERLKAKRQSERLKMMMALSAVLGLVVYSLLVIGRTGLPADDFWQGDLLKAVFGSQGIFRNGIGIVLPFLVVMPIIVDRLLTYISAGSSNEIADDLLREEKEKLQANLDATMASLRLNDKLGHYANVRQMRQGEGKR